MIIILSSFLLLNIINVCGVELPQPGLVNNCIQLTETCSSCTFVELTSIQYPDNTIEFYNINMTKLGTDYNYTFCNTSLLGTYLYKVVGDPLSVLKSQTVSFEITNSGRNFELGDILTYSFFLLICLVLIFLSTTLIVSKTKQKEKVNNQALYQTKKRNEFKYYVELLKSKLWIVGLFGVYLSLILFIGLANQLVYNLGFMDLNTILTNFFIVIAWGLIPFILFWLCYIIITFYKTTEEVMKYQFGNDTWRRQ